RLVTDPTGRTGDRMPAPVLLLEPEPLARWARMIAAPSAAHPSTALLLVPTPLPDTARRAASAAPAPDERVARFVRNASAPAQELAACLAVAPLYLPVVRLVQHTLVKSARDIHLAEVL